jgi:hypothetical protein
MKIGVGIINHFGHLIGVHRGRGHSIIIEGKCFGVSKSETDIATRLSGLALEVRYPFQSANGEGPI